ncbi:MAG: cysteine ABC transporter substrate-binding protein [Clostridiales Family XIII bacterium]|jgi:polar amino acid transport system substrate-binding protein|nr:cysteine ABC transporter substrate-binding protein [Clostridiales Family XIII bacterium]
MKIQSIGVKKAITAILVLGLALALTACGNSSGAQTSAPPSDQAAPAQAGAQPLADEGAGGGADLIAGDKVRIGVFSDKPPFGYLDANGDSNGFDIYIAKRVAKDLLGDESRVEFVLVEPATRVEYLESDKVDIIFANFTVTDERKEKVDFALPYMKVALGVVSPEAAPINAVEDLKGKKLIVIKGTTAETYFTENHPDIELVKFDQISEAFQALKDGRGAGLSQDNTLLFAWARENAGFTVGVSALGRKDVIAPAVRKGNEKLLAWLNDELKKLGAEQFIHAAYEAELRPAYGDSIDPENVVIEGGETR